MQPLAPDAILRICEEGQHQSDLQRAVTILSVACPALAADEAVHLPLGTRNLRLFQLRHAIFGPRIDAYTECADCLQGVEFAFDTGAFAAAHPPPTTAPGPAIDGWELTVRPLTTDDLVHASQARDVAGAREVLAARSVVAARHEGREVRTDDVPPDLFERLAGHLAAVDTHAECLVLLTCPACGATWNEDLDIARFFWAELRAEARRLLRAVHQLARAYGWSEHEILNLDPRRRAAYLALTAE